MGELKQVSQNQNIDEMPLEATTDTGILVVDFLSDNAGSGTGFLAKYEAKPKTFWDMYIVVGLSSISMLACVCCFCCWMRCKPEEVGGRQIENSLGLDLQSTERGASVTNLKKFPRFVFSEAHKLVMDDIGQTSSCTICLGDYENTEELRLLPCGHCFHAEGVDAWLQINRVCPICKVDVYDLLVEEQERAKKMKRMKRKKKKDKKKRDKRKKLSSHVLPQNPSDRARTKIPNLRKSKFVPEPEEDELEFLTPMEQFRKRSRRLLSVGERVNESGRRSVVSAGEEKLPEIEMTLISSVPSFMHGPESAVRAALRPGRVQGSEPQTSQNRFNMMGRNRSDDAPRPRPLPLILSNAFTPAPMSRPGGREAGQRSRRLAPITRRPASPLAHRPNLASTTNSLQPQINIDRWTMNSELSIQAREQPSSINQPTIGLVEQSTQQRTMPPVLRTRLHSHRRRSTIHEQDTLLESTF